MEMRPMKKPHAKGEMASWAVLGTALAGLLIACTPLVDGANDTTASLRRQVSTDKQPVVMIASATLMFHTSLEHHPAGDAEMVRHAHRDRERKRMAK